MKPPLDSADLGLAAFFTDANVPRELQQRLVVPAFDLEPVKRPLLRMGASHWGGVPHVPDEFAWPRASTGKPMAFVGQLDCASTRLPLMPRAGSLVFFMHDAECVVQWLRGDELALRPMTRAASPARPMRALKAREIFTMADGADLVWAQHQVTLSPAHRDAWRELRLACAQDDVGAICYGGHALPLPTHPDPRAQLDSATTWEPLLQFGDDRCRHFFVVPAADLRRGAFERTQLVSQRA